MKISSSSYEVFLFLQFLCILILFNKDTAEVFKVTLQNINDNDSSRNGYYATYFNLGWVCILHDCLLLKSNILLFNIYI